jgi:hypothetical protein
MVVRDRKHLRSRKTAQSNVVVCASSCSDHRVVDARQSLRRRIELPLTNRFAAAADRKVPQTNSAIAAGRNQLAAVIRKQDHSLFADTTDMATRH